MNLRDVSNLHIVEVTGNPDDPVNYLPKSSGGFGTGMLAGILFGLPFGFFGASFGALLGALAGAFVDQMQHAFNVANERRRVGWQGRYDW